MSRRLRLCGYASIELHLRQLDRVGAGTDKQLAAQLREQIESGEITSQLPSITDLTAQTGLAVGTVRRAIDVLVKEGLVQTVPGRGTFVR